MGRVQIGWSIAILALIAAVVWSFVTSLSSGAALNAPPPTVADTTRPASSYPASTELTIETKSGLLALSSLKGKVVLVDFWATYCGPCRKSIPFVEATYKKYKARGFEVMGVSLDAMENVPNIPPFVEEMGMTYPVGRFHSDDEISHYGSGAIPFMVLIDREGRVRGQWNGYSATMEPVIEDAIKALL